jgi:hypothetical protein
LFGKAKHKCSPHSISDISDEFAKVIQIIERTKTATLFIRKKVSGKYNTALVFTQKLEQIAPGRQTNKQFLLVLEREKFTEYLVCCGECPRLMLVVELYFRPELRSAISDLAAELATCRLHRGTPAALALAFSSARPSAYKYSINLEFTSPTFALSNKPEKNAKKCNKLHCILMGFKIT